MERDWYQQWSAEAMRRPCKPGKDILFEVCCCSYWAIIAHSDIVSFLLKAQSHGKGEQDFCAWMHSPGLNRPSQVSHGPVCHYLLQVSPNPGLTFVTAESDQYLWISTLSFLPGYRRSTRNITVSFYWDDGPLLGYSLALPLALWLLCSCGAFRDSFLHLHHLQSSLCSLRFLSPEGILCLSLPSQHGSLYQRPR